jgi:hypothetical protein
MNARRHQQSLDDQGGLANALPRASPIIPIVLAFAMVAALAVDLALIPRASAAPVRLIGRGRDAIINDSAAARYSALVGVARGHSGGEIRLLGTGGKTRNPSSSASPTNTSLVLAFTPLIDRAISGKCMLPAP